MGVKAVGSRIAVGFATFTNFFGGLPILGKFEEFTGKLDKLAPSQAIMDEFRDSVAFKGDLQPSDEAYKKFLGTRIKDPSDFKFKVAPTDASTLVETLKETATGAGAEATNAARKAVIDSLILPLVTPFEEGLRTLKDYIEAQATATNPKPVHPTDVRSYLSALKSETVEAIKAHQQKELEALNAPGIGEQLIASLGLSDAAAVEPIKEGLLKELQASHAHADGLAAFEKNMDEHLNKLHNGAQKEYDRIAYLARMSKTKKGKKQINELIGPDRVGVVQDGDKLAANALRNLSVDKLKEFRTLNGFKISEGPDGTYSFSLPNHFLSLLGGNPFYYSSPEQNIKADAASLAQLIKAQGHDSITITIQQSDPKKAAIMARKAYEACLEAGFDEKDISIEGHGLQTQEKEPKPVKATTGKELEEALFGSTEAHELKAAKEKGKKNNMDKDTLMGATSIPEAAKVFRKTLDDFRQAVPVAAPVAAPAAPGLS